MKGDADPHPGVREAKFFPVHGIDVSKWQGEINWTAVREANPRFVSSRRPKAATISTRSSSITGAVRARRAFPAPPIISCTGAVRAMSSAMVQPAYPERP